MKIDSSRIGAYYGAERGLYGSLADWNREVALGRQLRLGVMRLNTDAWDLIEPSRGTFNWVQMDILVGMVESEGMRLIFNTPISAVWNRPVRGTNLTPTTDYGAVEAFCRAVATRYAGRISFYEAWNEPDYSVFWGGQSDPAAYFEYLKAVHRGVRAGDPSAKILLGGLAGPENLVFMDSLIALGGLEYFDLMNIHIYPALSTVSGALAAARRTGKRIVVTEISSTGGRFETEDIQSEEQKKADYLVKSYAEILAQPDVDFVIWHTLRNPPDADFGLLSNSFDVLPAFTAHEALSNRLIGKEIYTARFATEIGERAFHVLEVGGMSEFPAEDYGGVVSGTLPRPVGWVGSFLGKQFDTASGFLDSTGDCLEEVGVVHLVRGGAQLTMDRVEYGAQREGDTALVLIKAVDTEIASSESLETKSGNRV